MQLKSLNHVSSWFGPASTLCLLGSGVLSQSCKARYIANGIMLLPQSGSASRSLFDAFCECDKNFALEGKNSVIRVKVIDDSRIIPRNTHPAVVTVQNVAAFWILRAVHVVLGDDSNLRPVGLHTANLLPHLSQPVSTPSPQPPREFLFILYRPHDDAGSGRIF